MTATLVHLATATAFLTITWLLVSIAATAHRNGMARLRKAGYR